MDFLVPQELSRELEQFRTFMAEHLVPHLSAWNRSRAVDREFYRRMGAAGWFGFSTENGKLVRHPALREALVTEEIAKVSPGVAITTLVVSDLGMICLYLFGSAALQAKYAEAAVRGETLFCLGNTENHAGSDVAALSMQAEKVSGGWRINGTKAYVTNGFISDLAVITAVTDPDADRNHRLSMFLVDLNADGVSRKKLNKQVWIPSDLTRLQFKDVFVPEDHLLGDQGKGLQQVLTVFTNSRVPISALTLGTAEGAFELALKHGGERKIFGERLIHYQAKSFESADFYARMEAARLMLYKTCWHLDRGEDFRVAASMSKYLVVAVARDVAQWAADLFGAASVILEHPVHKFPMDVWGSALGEGTQDVQKLIIFRELVKKYRIPQ